MNLVDVYMMERLTVRGANAGRSWIGFHVQDFFGWSIGRLAWLQVPEGKAEVQFLGIRTAWVTAQDLLVPAEGVRVDPTQGLARVPYGRDVLYKAPRHRVGVVLTPEREREVYDHFGLTITGSSTAEALPTLVESYVSDDSCDARF